MALATWSIVALNVVVFVAMLFGSGTLADPETLVAWGGNFGPRTTNAEWWRLVTALFVHAGPLHLLATLAGLIQVGRFTERVVGRLAFVAVYVAAGTIGNLVCLYTSPVSVGTGAAGAILGVYGLLIATWTWGWLRGSLPVCGPRRREGQNLQDGPGGPEHERLRAAWERRPAAWGTAKRVVPGIAAFLLYTAVVGRLGRDAYIAALALGAVYGLVLARGARDHRSAARRMAVVAVPAAALSVLLAVPLRGITDVRPEIGRIIAMEDRTTVAYDAAVLRFTNGAIRAAVLAQMIDQTIVPELRAARLRVAALQKVPPEYQRLVALAVEYLRLRDESWRLRSEALRTSRMQMLREADRREWQARNALGKIRDVDPGRT